MRIALQNITKRYGNVAALDNLNLTIEKGSLHFLLGPSGCGKTTALRVIAGLEAPTSGKVLFNDKNLTDTPVQERGIGMVFQNYALWPHMTVRKNIEYGLKLRQLSQKQIQNSLEEVLAITQLQRYVDRLPGQLSGGQQQRVAFARAMAIKPNVLLLDEPLSNLDAKLRLEMRDHIHRIHKQTKITTVYVTHDQKEALSMATHISILNHGELVQTEVPKNLYRYPNSPFVAGFIGETNLIKGIYLGKEQNYHKVQTSFAVLTVNEIACSFNKGDQVLLSLRPEAIKIKFSGQQEQKPNQFSLSLQHLVYLGELEQFQLIASDKTSVKINVFNPPEHSFRELDDINCHVNPNDILAFRCIE